MWPLSPPSLKGDARAGHAWLASAFFQRGASQQNPMLKLNCASLRVHFKPRAGIAKVLRGMPAGKENGKKTSGAGEHTNQFTDADSVKVLYSLGFFNLAAQKMKCCWKTNIWQLWLLHGRVRSRAGYGSNRPLSITFSNSATSHARRLTDAASHTSLNTDCLSWN